MSAVLFYCGVDPVQTNLTRRFPNSEKWQKLTATCSDEDLLNVFNTIVQLIDGHNIPERTPERGAGNQKLDGRRRKRRQRTNRKNSWIFPDKGRCDQETRACVVFEEDIPKNCVLEVEVRGQSSHTNKRLGTTRINASSFEFLISEGMCEELKLGFMRDGTCIAVGSFQHESPLDDIDPTMQLLISCMDAICKDDVKETLNTKLHRIFASDSHSHIPTRAFEQLFSLYELNTKAECTIYPLPTLLHFVAKYGLQDVAATLVGLPGAYQAYCLQNADGHTPYDLAKEYGHPELTNFLYEYFDTVEKEEAIYDALHNYLQTEGGHLDLNELDREVKSPEAHSGKSLQRKRDSYLDMSQSLSASSVDEPINEEVYLAMSGPEMQKLNLDQDVPPNKHSDSGSDSYLDMNRSGDKSPMIPQRAEMQLQRSLSDQMAEENLPSIDLPSPLASPGVLDPGHRKRLDTFHKEDHVESMSSDVTDASLEGRQLGSRVSVNPFPTLLGPDQQPPPECSGTTDCQNELVEIMRGFKEGMYTISDCENMAENWKQRNQINRSGKTFKEKKESIKVQQRCFEQGIKKVEEEIPKGGGGFMNILKKKIRRKPVNKSSSAPVKAKTFPEMDPVKMAAAAAAMKAVEEDNPVCDSLPELPPSQTAIYNQESESYRFSTISNSSSSSSASGLSHISCSSHQDSGIDVAKREDSPYKLHATRWAANTPSSTITLDTQVQLPVKPKSSKSTSDEGSGYEDMENWTNSDHDSVKRKGKSDSSQESLSATADDPTDPPPLPPRRKSSACTYVVARTKQPAPRPPLNTGRTKSCLPTPNKTPIIPPKPMHKEGGGIPVRRNNSGCATGVPRPVTAQQSPNYSNVVFEMESTLKQRGTMKERREGNGKDIEGGPKLPPPRKISVPHF